MTLSNNNQLTSVAVAGGTGDLGKFIVRALLAEGKYQVKILYRSASAPNTLHQEFKSNGGEMVPVDYTSVQNLTEALNGVHTVLCTFGFGGVLENQLNLLQASKKAQVIKFVPSEYGIDGEAEKYETFADKDKVRKAVEASGLDYTYYNNGFFLEHCLSETYNLDLTKDNIKVIGNGDANLSLTSIKDVARYIAKTLTKLETKNRNINILGETTSINKIIKFAEQVRGKPYQIVRIPEDEILAIPDLHASEKLVEYASTMILLFMSKGEVYIEENSFNSELAGPNFITLKVEEYVKSLLG